MEGAAGVSLTSFAEARVMRRVARCGVEAKKREVSSVALGVRIVAVVRRRRIMGGLSGSLVRVVVVARGLRGPTCCTAVWSVGRGGQASGEAIEIGVM